MKTRKSKIIMIITISIPLFLCFIIICNLINDSVRIINSKETIYSTSQAFAESAYKTQTITLSLIGIAISVWIGLNLYNVLSKEELKVLLEQAEKAAEITQKVYTEVLMSKFRMSHTDSTANFYAIVLEEIDILPDIILEKLISIEDLYRFSFNLYKEHFSTKYNDIGRKQCDELLQLCQEYKQRKIINTKQFSLITGYLYIRSSDFSFYKTQYDFSLTENHIDSMAKDIINNYEQALKHIFRNSDITTFINPERYSSVEKSFIASIANSIGAAYLLFVKNLTPSELKKIICTEKVAINFGTEISPKRKAVFLRNMGTAYEKNSNLDEAYKQYLKSYELNNKSVKTAHCLAYLCIKQINQLFPNFVDNFPINNVCIYSISTIDKEHLIKKIKQAAYWLKIKNYNNNGIMDGNLIILYQYLYKLTNNKQYKSQLNKLNEDKKIIFENEFKIIENNLIKQK